MKEPSGNWGGGGVGGGRRQNLTEEKVMTQEDGGQACHTNTGFYIFYKYLLDLSDAMILVLSKQKYPFQGKQTNSESMCSSPPQSRLTRGGTKQQHDWCKC